MSTAKTVVPIVSGGLDSVTMLYTLTARGFTIRRVVSFDYGQRHKKELQFAAAHAEKVGAEHTVINLHASGLSEILAKSSSVLTNPDTDVPEGHYAEENMKATVVPNRNMVMLSIAASIAIADEADHIAAAVHSGDHFIYPDCRPIFMYALNEAINYGNQGFGLFPEVKDVTVPHNFVDFILTPFITMSKADIAAQALFLQVPLELTWSCYKGGEIHCGRCGTCVERLEAIDIALKEKVPGTLNKDFTEYEDTEYWRTAIKEGVK